MVTQGNIQGAFTLTLHKVRPVMLRLRNDAQTHHGLTHGQTFGV